MGDGEWHAHKHRTSNKRRAWRKLHLGVDGEWFIIATELTDSGVDDASVGAAMIEGIDAAIARFTADGAYDTRAIYEALRAAGAPGPTIVIPPRKTASPSKPAEDVFQQRDAPIARIAEVGRRQWRKEAGAHQQARAENGMFRYKRNIGHALRARKPGAQKREALIAVNVANGMTGLGMPESVAVAAQDRVGEGPIQALFGPCNNATAPAITTAPAEHRGSVWVMRPWSWATRTSSVGSAVKRIPTGPARIADPFPAEGAGVAPAEWPSSPEAARSW